MRKERERVEFQVTEDHIRRGRRNDPRGDSLALALQEAGLAVNPAVHPITTLEMDEQGKKLRTYTHAPPVNRWLNEWNRGNKVTALQLSLDLPNKRINTNHRKRNVTPGRPAFPQN